MVVNASSIGEIAIYIKNGIMINANSSVKMIVCAKRSKNSKILWKLYQQYLMNTIPTNITANSDSKKIR